MLRTIAIFSLLLVPAFLFGDLDEIKKDPNLERRSDRALEAGSKAVDDAKQSYVEGKDAQFRAALKQVTEAADLSYDALKTTGKPARKKPKYFKRAELALRAMMRKLDGLEQEVGVDDRTTVRSVKQHVSELHDKVLIDIMTKK